MIKCYRCNKLIPSAVEERALRKLREKNEEEWEKLRKLRCGCVRREGSQFTSRPQPSDLQWHDKYDR